MEENKTIPGLIRYSQSKCMQCGTISGMREYHGLDLSQNPEGKDMLLKGEFFRWSCPKCGMKADTAWPCWYFDRSARLGISLVPGIDSSSGGGAVQAMNRNLEGLALPGMTHRVAGSFYAMQEVVRAQDLGLDHRVVQLVKPLIIGQFQSAGKEVWNGFFQGVSVPNPAEEPVRGVLYASEGKEPSYGRPIYWYDIHLTSRTVIRAGVNEMLFQMCQQMLERLGEGPDDGTFRLYDLNWAISCHNRMRNG